ncbi:MAG TPA: hypothetical protein VFI11_01255, partial [Anaerolineales bacterium]|nr:hypothetical protein [Anaerolineales bacterium]
MNQPVAAGEDPFMLTDRLYGSAEENDNSVVRAILNNPAAFAQRILSNLRSLPDVFLEFFGKRLGIMVLLLAAWGAYGLIRRRDPWDLVIMVLWAAPAAVSLAFLPRHFIPQSSHLPLVLAAVGVVFPISRDATRVEAVFFGLTAIGLGVYSLLDNKLAFLPGAALLLAVWGIVWLLRRRHLLAEDSLAVPLLLAFIAGLIVRSPFTFPDYPHFGTLPRERAVHYLEQNLPTGSRVISALPLPAIAARMEQVIPDKVRQPSSALGVCGELRILGVGAIYVDEALRSTHPVLLDSLRQLVGKGLEIGITADPGSFQVFLVTPPCLASDS